MKIIGTTYKIPLSGSLVSDFTIRTAASPRQTGKPPEEFLFISIKRNKKDFVLVRIFDPACFSIIRCLSIERQLNQLEVRYVRNKYELEEMKRTQKLRSEGFYVELEKVGRPEYMRYERLARRHMQKIFLRKP